MKKRCVLLLIVLTIILSCMPAKAQAADNSEIYDIVSKSVVRILNTYQKPGENDTTEYRGSGFFINENQIVTNHHVVNSYGYDIKNPEWFKTVENRIVRVYYSEISADYVEGTVVADWPDVDLAVIQIQTEYAKRVPLTLLDASKIKPLMQVWATGFPAVNSERDVISSNVLTVTQGIITKITPTAHLADDSTPYVELGVDAIINEGASGGPIVDEHGHVVGINDLRIIDEDNNQAWFGIQVNELMTRLDSRGFSYRKTDHRSAPIVVETPSKVGPTLTPVITMGPGGNSGSFPWLWVVIGVLGLAVIVMLIVLLTGKGGSGGKGSKGGSGGGSSRTSGSPSVQGMSGKFQGISKPLSMEKDCVFGKDPDCTFRFEDKTISSRHCRIHYSKSNQRFVVQDLGSTNGTIIVRGRQQSKVPTDSAIALRDGDMIYIVDKGNAFKVNL